MRKLKCKSLFLYIGEEYYCNKPAAYRFDAGKKGGYAVCEECAKSIPPKRLTRIVQKGK